MGALRSDGAISGPPNRFTDLVEGGEQASRRAVRRRFFRALNVCDTPILNALVEKLKRRSKDDFKGRHFEATLILQAVSWYLRYPLSYRDIEELFLERGLEVDHATLNRWVLAYAPLIERRLRTFRKPPCGSIRVDETYIKVRGQWRYLYRAIDKHGTPVDFLLTAKRDLEAAKRFFRKALKDQPLLSPDRIGTDGAGAYPPAIAAARKDGLLARTPVH